MVTVLYLGTRPLSQKRTSCNRTLCQSTVRVWSWDRWAVNDLDLKWICGSVKVNSRLFLLVVILYQQNHLLLKFVIMEKSFDWWKQNTNIFKNVFTITKHNFCPSKYDFFTWLMDVAFLPAVRCDALSRILVFSVRLFSRHQGGALLALEGQPGAHRADVRNPENDELLSSKKKV